MSWHKDNFTCPQVWLCYLNLVQHLARNILQTGHTPKEQFNSIRVPHMSRRKDTCKASVNGKYSDFISKKKGVLFNYCNKTKKCPFKKIVPFPAYVNFLSFHSLVLKEKPLFAVKIYSFLEKKKKAFCFHSTKLGNIKGKAATYFAFQRIWRNVI